MSDSVKQHLPVIVAVTIIAILSGAYALVRVHDGAAGMDVATFSTYVFLFPCIAMLIASLLIMATAQVIGRQLYVVVVAICFVVGIVSMVVTSTWMSDPAIAAALLANSAEGEVIRPIVEQPLIVMRDIAAYIVVPTVGCIAGAWIGSRIHPIEREGRAGGKVSSKNSKKKSKR